MKVFCATIGRRASFTVDNSKSLHGLITLTPDPQTKENVHEVSVGVGRGQPEHYDSDEFAIAYKRAIGDVQAEVRIIFVQGSARIPSDEENARKAYTGRRSCAA